jgi:hypothetical protein
MAGGGSGLKKKTYKHMINRILRLEKAARCEASRRKEMEEAAKFYKDRLQSIGKNMQTVDVNSEVIRTIKWEIHPQAWGEYVCIDLDSIVSAHDEKYLLAIMQEKAVNHIARGLIEKDLVQFIIKNQDMDISDPLNQCGTLAAKLYVIPWERMPHKGKIELIEMEMKK